MERMGMEERGGFRVERRLWICSLVGLHYVIKLLVS